jgi:hypothetical protein
MKNLLVLIAFLFINKVYSQSLAAEWAIGLSSSLSARCTAIDIDNEGNIYATGYFKSSVDFDPGPEEFILSNGINQDIFVAKYSSLGELIWAKQIGADGADAANDIQVDGIGRIHLTGTYMPPCNFNPASATVVSPAPRGGMDLFILTLDNDGNYLRVFGGGGSEDDEGKALVVDSDNNIYVTGTYEGSATIRYPGQQSSSASFAGYGLRDVFMLKIGSDLNVVWDEQLGGANSDDISNCIALDADNNLVIGGSFSATCNFNTPSGNNNYVFNASGNKDCFITKRANNGNFLMANVFGGSNEDAVTDISIDNSGSIYSTGYFEANADFNPDNSEEFILMTGLPSSGKRTFVQKLDNNANFVWAKQIQSSTVNVGNAIHVTSDQDIYLSGYFVETADFDPGISEYNLTSTNMTGDVYTLRLDAIGDFLEVKTFGGSIYDEAFDIHVDAQENVYVVGRFASSYAIASGIELEGASNENGFIVKYGFCQSSQVTDNITSCGPYTWIDGNTYNISNNTATFVLSGANVSGCDSIINLNLTVNPGDAIDANVIMLPNQQLQSQATGVTYQWLNCNDGFNAIPGETNQLFTPIEVGFYAVALSNGTCTDTSECVEGVIIGIDDKLNGNYKFIYPNPGNGIISWSSPLTPERIIVHNSIGIKVYDEILPDATSRMIHLNGAAGVYFVSVIIQGEQFGFKYIKQ